MITLLAFFLVGSTANQPAVQNTKAANSSILPPVFAEQPKGSNGLTLYNENGEVVARCGKKDENFHDCKMEPGVTLDDLMNAWVHAYLDAEK